MATDHLWLPTANKMNSILHILTHLPLDKMAAVLTDDNLKCIFLNEIYRILIQISLKFVPNGLFY